MTQQNEPTVQFITTSRLVVTVILCSFSAALVFGFASLVLILEGEAFSVEDAINNTLEPIAFVVLFAVACFFFCVPYWIYQFLVHIRKDPAYIAAKERKKQEKLKKKEAGKALQNAIKKIPAHKKVEGAMALDDENSIIYVKPSLFASWMSIDYDDLVSWQEKWVNVVSTTGATEKNNVVNLTVRGPQGPTIEVHLSNAKWRNEVYALLNANFR